MVRGNLKLQEHRRQIEERQAAYSALDEEGKAAYWRAYQKRVAPVRQRSQSAEASKRYRERKKQERQGERIRA